MKKTIFVLSILIIFAPVFTLAHEGGENGDTVGHMMENNMSWWNMGWGWLGILFWVLIILAIVAVIKWLIDSNKNESQR